MKRLRALFESLAGARLLRPFKPVVQTIGGILLGSHETTVEAPHIRDRIEIKRYMSVVILALMPATVAAVVFFGWKVVAMIAVSYAVGGVIEVLFAIIRKREIEEGFLVTGLIFPLILPPTAPLWMVAVGSAFGVFFGKEVFGGTGRNIFNPALVGRIFITIAFPELMSARWVKPFTDAVTSATPLGLFKAARQLTPLRDLLFGQVTGSIGELFRIGVIAGGLFLILTRVANWRVPLAYLGSVALFSAVGSLAAPAVFAPPQFQLLAGGLLFGAFFMATDPVSSPSTRGGKWVFGLICGIVTLLIRTFSGFTEGVMFSILFMNAFAPLLDTIVLNVKYRAAKI
jgi:Na+-transporting NADH:ubiquinone oxidoreductase subunit B/electron transport complex protein RnfD